MPLYLCRWPNRDCSVVWASNKEDAIFELDEVGNAEPARSYRFVRFRLILSSPIAVS